MANEFAIRPLDEVEKALLSEKLETQRYITAAKKFEAAREQLELEEYEAMVRSAQASNFRHRTYDFVAPILEPSVEQAVDLITRWARENNRPITVRFTSPGGDIMSGTVLYDTLRALDSEGTPITTVCLGQAASMAAVLLQAGRERVIGESAWILIHESKLGSDGLRALSDLDDDVKFGKKLQERLVSILASRSKLKPSEIAKRAKKGDWWLSAHDVVKFGFADRVGYR